MIVGFAVGAGVMAGVQIGKVPPSLPVLRQSRNADLITAGWIISVFNLLAALLGIVSGLIADRLGSRNMVAAGLLMLSLGAISGSFAMNVEQLIMARIVAGLGLVSIAVSSPRLIVMASSQNDRSLALGIWSIYTPAGMALGMAIAPLLFTTIGWRGLWAVDSFAILLFLGFFLYASRKFSKTHDEGAKSVSHFRDIAQVITHIGPWLLGAVFALYAIQFFAVMSWLPSFLVETFGYTNSGAALAAAMVVACNVVGNLGGAWSLHHGAQRWVLQLSALLVMAACSIGIYPDFLDSSWKLPLAMLFSMAGGMLPAATLAASAVHAPTPGYVSTVNGVIVQCTNIGSLSGPPLMATLVSYHKGWQQSWKMLVFCSLLGAIVVLVLRKIEIGKNDSC